MVKMYNEDSGALIGEVSQEAYQFLVKMLEEESTEDVDYFINEITIDMLEARGGDAALIDMLRGAVGESEGIEVTWVHN